MLSVYPACFFRVENTYSVIFPDLNGLSTSGETIEYAMSMAVDYLALYLYTSHMEGNKIPVPSAIENISLETVAKELEIEYSNGFINMVSVDVDAYAKQHFEKSVKKTLTIPAWLNKAALEQNINFSQVLQEALINKIRSQ